MLDESSPLPALFTPWTQLLQRGRASCSVRSRCGRNLVARVDVDLFSLLHGQDADAVVRTIRSLRELLELLRLAFHADARTLRALVACGLVRDGFGDFLPRHGVEPNAMEVVLSMVKFTLDEYVALEHLREFLTTKTVRRGGLFMEAKQALGELYPYPSSAPGGQPLKVVLHVVSPAMKGSDRQRRREKAAEFFEYLDQVAKVLSAQMRAITGRSEKLESDHLLSLDTSVRLLVRTLPLTPVVVETVRALMSKHQSVVVCGFVTLHPREIECPTDDICAYLEALTSSCAEATVQIGEEIPAPYRPDSDVEAAWQKQIDSILSAVVAVRTPFQTLDIGPLASSLSWTINQEVFWYTLVEKVLQSPTVFKQLRYQSTLGGLSEAEAVFIRRARRTKDPDHLCVGFERICVGEVEEPSEHGIMELFQLVANPNTKELIVSTFSEGGSLSSPHRVLELFPAVEDLTLGAIAVESMHVFTAFYENQTSCTLHRLALRDLTIQDASSIATFLDGLRPGRSKLSQSLEVLRFDQQTWDINGNFAFDEAMVEALARLLQYNHNLREVAIIVRENVSTEARQRLLSHVHDVVRPPQEVREHDLRSRLGFFSVVDHMGMTSPIGKLDSLALRRIFEFSTTHWTRQIGLADEMPDENAGDDDEGEFAFDHEHEEEQDAVW